MSKPKKEVSFPQTHVDEKLFMKSQVEKQNMDHLVEVLKSMFAMKLEQVISEGLTNFRGINEDSLPIKDAALPVIKKRIEYYYLRKIKMDSYTFPWEPFYALLKECKDDTLGEVVGFLLRKQFLLDEEAVNPTVVLLLKMSNPSLKFNCKNECDPYANNCKDLYDLIMSILDEQTRNNPFTEINFLYCFNVQFKAAFGCNLIGMMNSSEQEGGAKYRYIIEPFNIEGDIIKKLIGSKIVSQKIVPNKELKKIAKEIQKIGHNNAEKSKHKIVCARNTGKNKFFVRDTTNFAKYLKITEVGPLTMNALISDISKLFHTI
jgi:hypothetical protein